MIRQFTLIFDISFLDSVPPYLNVQSEFAKVSLLALSRLSLNQVHVHITLACKYITLACFECTSGCQDLSLCMGII